MLKVLLKWFIKFGPTRILIRSIITALISIGAIKYFQWRDEEEGYYTEKQKVLRYRVPRSKYG